MALLYRRYMSNTPKVDQNVDPFRAYLTTLVTNSVIGFQTCCTNPTTAVPYSTVHQCPIFHNTLFCSLNVYIVQMCKVGYLRYALCDWWDGSILVSMVRQCVIIDVTLSAPDVGWGGPLRALLVNQIAHARSHTTRYPYQARDIHYHILLPKCSQYTYFSSVWLKYS